MDVVLGVAVTGPVARLALVGPDGREVIDEFALDVTDAATEQLASTIVGTHDSFVRSGHRLASTRMCWPGDERGVELTEALTAAGVRDVGLISEPDAATALVRATGGSDSALLFVDDDTATLTIVGADPAATTVIAAEPVNGAGALGACSDLLARLREEPGAATGVLLVGTSVELPAIAEQLRPGSPLPLTTPDGPDFALARGAALSATSAKPVAAQAPEAAAKPALGALGSLEAAMSAIPGAATIASPQLDPPLAYSLTSDSGPLPMDFATGQLNGAVPLQRAMPPLSQTPDPEEADVVAAVPPPRPRALLVGSTVAAIVVVGFAALAVTVAIQIRPTASAAPEQRVLIPDQVQIAPTFVPVLPTTPVAPAPAPPAEQPVPAGNPGLGPVFTGATGPAGGGGGAPVQLPPAPLPASDVGIPAPDGAMPPLPPPPGGLQLPFQIPPITINMPGGGTPPTGNPVNPNTVGTEGIPGTGGISGIGTSSGGIQGDVRKPLTDVITGGSHDPLSNPVTPPNPDSSNPPDTGNVPPWTPKRREHVDPPVPPVVPPAADPPVPAADPPVPDTSLLPPIFRKHSAPPVIPDNPVQAPDVPAPAAPAIPDVPIPDIPILPKLPFHIPFLGGGGGSTPTTTAVPIP